MFKTIARRAINKQEDLDFSELNFIESIEIVENYFQMF